MDMHPAAIAPNQPLIHEGDRKHPLFAKYMEHRMSCTRLLITASSFADWLHQEQASTVRETATQHPRYTEFLHWMIDHRGGGRKCPAGSFPQNFEYWLAGGRW